MDQALKPFHPLTRAWFTERFGNPTSAQCLAWPRIAANEHVLVIAPTGSGKTLTAFLWAIDQLLTGRWGAGEVRVLYISPMRALNNDIRRNLIMPLDELSGAFAKEGLPVPAIRAMTRSGDTTQSDRQKMRRRPPEILITTPESLNIMLTGATGAQLFTGLKTVILDEVHAVVGSKRGTHLITGVERLVRLSGEFQRIALSATVNPKEAVAPWIGGYTKTGTGGEPHYDPRQVRTVEARQKKTYAIETHYSKPPVPPAEAHSGDNPIWQTVADRAARRIADNRSTLVFANSRRGVERMARLINSTSDTQPVYAHHGSLAREIREVVEERLKEGQLQGIVATNSLELGIDIGAIDEVLLVGTPPSVSSTVQRVGRAGHGVGQTSRGQLYPLHAEDIIDAAVAVPAMLSEQIEPLLPPEAPLDVLAQILLSMTSTEQWSLDELFNFIRCMAPYHELSRGLFDLVVEMLAGKYAGTRVAALKPRVALDRLSHTVRARPGVARILYASGGTIPDRGYFRVRLSDSGSVIGELDEEFVWERSNGDAITLGVQSWRVNGISQNDVWVTPTGSAAPTAPFWRCEDRFSTFWFADQRGRFLEQAEAALSRADAGEEITGFEQTLTTERKLDPPAATELMRYLRSQRTATGTALPHRHHLVVEHAGYTNQAGAKPLTVLHTTWGGRVNRPLALALSAALEQRHGQVVEVAYDEGCVAVELPEPCSVADLFDPLDSADLEQLVRDKLESTGFFGAHFRENAARALLLLRAGFDRRTPLWLTRQRAKELQTAVGKYTDFPILLETWRTCLRDEIELSNLAALLDEVRSGHITISEVSTPAPSPFAAEVVWRRTGELMYEDDTPTGPASSLSADLIQEVVFAPHLRPKIAVATVRTLAQKLHRTAPGYAPRDPAELIEWIKERLLIPLDEWRDLLAAIERDHQLEADPLGEAIARRVVGVAIEEPRNVCFICAAESLPRLRKALDWSAETYLVSPKLDGTAAPRELLEEIDTLAAQTAEQIGTPDEELSGFLAEWLRFYPPLSLPLLARTLEVEPGALARAVDHLQRERQVVVDELTTAGQGLEVCDLRNLARLLRMTRAAAKPSFEPVPLDRLPLFLAEHQRLGEPGEQAELQETLEQLFGYLAPAGMWEEEIFPARLPDYQPAWLDALISGTDLMWYGRDKRQIGYALAEEQELVATAECPNPADETALNRLMPDRPGRFTVTDLLTENPGLTSADLMARLWQLTFAGLITNDSFAAVRKAVLNDFKEGQNPPTAPSGRPSRRGRFARWQATRTFDGSWHRIPPALDGEDPLEREELNRERARLLLERYGVLFRELLAREIPTLQWRALFRTLRLMELSGEVVGGHFFSGLKGLQFITHGALQQLSHSLPEDKIYWTNAADPASACGLGLESLDLPQRVITSHLVWHGRRLVVISKRRGKILEIRVPPDDAHLPQYFGFLESLLTRPTNPLRAVTIESINDSRAATSPYCEVLVSLFDTTRDHRVVRLSKRY